MEIPVIHIMYDLKSCVAHDEVRVVPSISDEIEGIGKIGEELAEEITALDILIECVVRRREGEPEIEELGNAECYRRGNCEHRGIWILHIHLEVRIDTEREIQPALPQLEEC